uniref:Secreted protein n=1 Tax=Cacopsylla melanoneura TaxID=428564 RepID=A0A8D8R536_9HEMI
MCVISTSKIYLRGDNLLLLLFNVSATLSLAKGGDNACGILFPLRNHLNASLTIKDQTQNSSKPTSVVKRRTRNQEAGVRVPPCDSHNIIKILIIIRYLI